MALPSSSARRIALVVALGAFVLVAVAGALAHHDKPLGVPKAQAIARAKAAPQVRDVLRPGDRAQTLYVDEDLVKVQFYRGDRAVAVAGVDAKDGIVYEGAHENPLGWGAPFTHRALPLAALALLFLLVTLRVPLRRNATRTVDLLAICALVVPAVLFDQGSFARGQALIALLLLYLLARGAVLALRGPSRAEDPGAPVLLEAIAARAGLPHLVRQIGWALLAATVLITLTSNGVIDIAFADMEGATVLLQGHLPYGNMPAGDIIHGDTYGLPIYAFSAPFAALWPMHDGWDDPIGALVSNALLVLLCVWGLARTIERARRWTAIVAFLAFPATLMSVSSGTNDLLIAALLLWAFLWWTRPVASSALVMLAGAAKIAPLVLLPLWLARLRGRELVAATAVCAGIGVAVLAALVAIGGLHGPLDMADAIAFQLSRRSELAVWTQLPVAGLQPLAQGLTMAVALGGAALVFLDREIAADPRRVAGLVTAVLAGLQLSANHWAPMYLLWLAPPVMLALAGPLGARAPVAAHDALDAEAVPAGAKLAAA